MMGTDGFFFIFFWCCSLEIFYDFTNCIMIILEAIIWCNDENLGGSLLADKRQIMHFLGWSWRPLIMVLRTHKTFS